jgi:hypothetical protein
MIVGLYPKDDIDSSSTSTSPAEWVTIVALTLQENGITDVKVEDFPDLLSKTESTYLDSYGCTIDYTDKPSSVTQEAWDIYESILENLQETYRKELGSLAVKSYLELTRGPNV